MNAIAISVAMVFFTSTSVSIATASLGEEDVPDKYRSIPALHECWIDGYEDAKQGKYDLDRALECTRLVDPGTPYREAAVEGCLDGGYPEEDCLEILH